MNEYILTFIILSKYIKSARKGENGHEEYQQKHFHVYKYLNHRIDEIAAVSEDPEEVEQLNPKEEGSQCVQISFDVEHVRITAADKRVDCRESQS